MNGRRARARGFVGSGPGRSCPGSGEINMKEGLTILRSRHGMKINLYTQAIFTSPFESFEDILPAGTSHERFVAPRLDRPEWDRDADPVQTGTSDLGKILLGLQHAPVGLAPTKLGGISGCSR